MENDPLSPATWRFPVNFAVPPLSNDRPSSARPFILLGVPTRPVPPDGGPISAKHRTSPGNTLVKQTCNEDGRMVDDSYTVPDE
jgi:hypothetical protein